MGQASCFHQLLRMRIGNLPSPVKPDAFLHKADDSLSKSVDVSIEKNKATDGFGWTKVATSVLSVFSFLSMFLLFKVFQVHTPGLNSLYSFVLGQVLTSQELNQKMSDREHSHSFSSASTASTICPARTESEARKLLVEGKPQMVGIWHVKRGWELVKLFFWVKKVILLNVQWGLQFGGVLSFVTSVGFEGWEAHGSTQVALAAAALGFSPVRWCYWEVST